MLDFTKFAHFERWLVLAMLWSMPWASAGDMSRVSKFTEASIGRHLKELRVDGLVFAYSMGRLTRRQLRWALSRSGIDEARYKLEAGDSSAISEENLFRLAHRLDTAESAYRALPLVWADESPRPVTEPEANYQELGRPTLTFTHYFPNGRNWGDVVIFSHKAILSGFTWLDNSFFDCLAEFVVPDDALTDTDLVHLQDSGRVRRITVPLVRHGVRPRNAELAIGPNIELTELDRVAGRVYAGLETTSEYELSGTGKAVDPPLLVGVAILAADAFSATAADACWYGGFPRIVFYDNGIRLRSEQFICPQGAISTPDVAVDYGKPEDVVKRLAEDPMIPKGNCQLFWRLFTDVAKWSGITEKELVRKHGRTRPAAIRTSLADMAKSGNVVQLGDGYRLTDDGKRYLYKL